MSSRRGHFSLNAVWAIPLLMATTAGLGVSGWLAHGAPLGDALYKSVSLFDLGNDVYNGYGPVHDWRFDIARWTGLATVFAAAAAAIATVLRERVAVAVARWMRQEVIIVGGEGIATKAFEAARDSGRSVVWLGAAAIGGDSVRAIALPWPPEDTVRTVFDHAADADHVLVAHDDDANALALVRAARAAAPAAFITVIMHDARLAEDTAATMNEARTRVLSRATISARALTIAHPPFLEAREAGHARVHALIVGFGQTGQAIARDLIVNGRTTYLGLPAITVIDPKARALEGVIRARAPEIDACADFTFIDGEVGSESIAPDPGALAAILGGAGPITAAYVCLHGDADALATAAMLQSLLRTLDIPRPPIFVRLRDASTLGTPGEGHLGIDVLTPFGDLEAVLAASEFLSREPDVAARQYAEAYRAALSAEKRNDPNNRSARPWDELDETFRQANRDVAAHIPAKMASAGVDPAAWKGVVGLPRLPKGQCLFKNDADLERLAELEHERWNAQRRMDGWRWTERPKKDEARRLTPFLVEYDELTDEVQEYDRIMVRETQAVCQGASGS